MMVCRYSYFEWEGGWRDSPCNHINYSYTKHEKGRGGGESGPYITVLISILGMGGGSRPYITVNSWDGRGVQTIHYNTISYIPSLGWEGGPDHKLQYH